MKKILRVFVLSAVLFGGMFVCTSCDDASDAEFEKAVDEAAAEMDKAIDEAVKSIDLD